MDKYDAIIIGAGIGGLTCALLLAKKGMRVAVFEKEKQPGGYCSSFSVDGYIFDACINCIGGLRKGELLRCIVEEELGVWDRVDFYELNPIQRNLFPDIRIDIPADVDLYKDILKKIFPAERDGIDKVFSVMEAIYASSLDAMCGAPDSDLSLDFFNKSFYDVVSSFIFDEKLKTALSSYCTFLAVPAQEASAISASNILMHYIKGGAFRVRGGIQRLSDVIGAALKDCAGELCLGEEVISIYSNGRQAVGVVTKNGRKVQAEHIISNIDVKSAIRMMKGGLSQEEKLSRVKGLEVSGSFVLVYLGVKDDLHSYDLASSTGYFSSYGLNEMLNRNGQFFYGVSFSSLYDSSLAPLGCDNLVIHCPFCYNEARAEIPKDKIGIALIERLCEIMPSLTEKIVYKSVAGPCTLERRTGNAFGAAYGWKQDLNFLKNLPLLRNLLKNFHIVGHWAGYGGGVMPSMLSAYKVVRDIVKQEALL